MTDHIAELKKVKIPLWSTWLGRYRAWQRRKEAAKEIYYITTVITPVKVEGAHKPRLYYVLKETGTGKRLYEFSAEWEQHECLEKRNWYYNQLIVPWMLKYWTNKQVITWVKEHV